MAACIASSDAMNLRHAWRWASDGGLLPSAMKISMGTEPGLDRAFPAKALERDLAEVGISDLLGHEVTSAAAREYTEPGIGQPELGLADEALFSIAYQQPAADTHAFMK